MSCTAKRFGIGWVGGVVALFTMASMTLAVPSFVNFQGRVLDGEDNPLAGPVDIEIAVFDAAIDGTELYREAHLGTSLVNGVYSIWIGQGTSPLGTFDADTFAADNRWLEVAIDGETLTPRQPFASVAFAFQAQLAGHAATADTASDADTVDGLEAMALDQSAALTAHVGDTANPHNVTATQTGAATSAALADHAADSGAHHGRYTDGEAVNAVLANDGPGSGLDADRLDGQEGAAYGSAAQVAANQTEIAALQTQVAALETTVAALQNLLQHLSRSGNDLFITGANLHLRSGSGATAGTHNGLGNLIVGYNEPRGDGTDDRGGSHNLVVGTRNNFSSHGGLVAGDRNSVTAAYASVTAGYSNTASGIYASVSGGRGNMAQANRSSVTGGRDNIASGSDSSVSGGQGNVASGDFAVVVGGGGGDPSDRNEAFADYSAILGGETNWTGDPAIPPTDHSIGAASTVSGGGENKASGSQSSVSGGSGNRARGDYSSVSGGSANIADGGRSSVSGGSSSAAEGDWSSVSGGWGNTPSGSFATVSGGQRNTASGNYSSVGGGAWNTASGHHASVLGGGGAAETDGNEAFANYSAILGGQSNWTGDTNLLPTDHTIGERSTVSGGAWNAASGEGSSVSGGEVNIASGGRASVSGGAGNAAQGDWSSVSGGNAEIATGEEDWRAGSCYFCDN